MTRKWSRLPHVRQSINSLIPEVRRRNRKALLDAGAESALLYLPDGVVDSAQYDDIHQTFKNDEQKYRLYLNRTIDEGTRVYTNDTENVPSILIAFPANPDTQTLREEGLVLTSRVTAWTLWDPIIPERGTIIRRINSKQQEWWLVDNVVVSYWAKLNKDSTYILHQEFMLSPITMDSGIDVDKFPSLEDTLALYKNKFDYTYDVITPTGTTQISESNQWLKMIGPASITKSGSYGDVQVQFDTQVAQNAGTLTVKYPSWNNASQPSFQLNFGTDQVLIRLNDSTIVKTTSFNFSANTFYQVRTSYKNGLAKLYINNVLVTFYEFRVDTNFNTLSPLAPGNVVLSVSGGASEEYRIKNFYIMSHV